jgi:tetratricopeptide (TPR) repeat protein
MIVHSHAQHAARHTGDLTEQARALANLGSTHWRLGRHAVATEHLQQALILCRQTGDRAGQARTLTSLGIVESRSGDYQAAVDHFTEALTLFRQTGDRAGEGSTLNDLGIVEGWLGSYRYIRDSRHPPRRQSVRPLSVPDSTETWPSPGPPDPPMARGSLWSTGASSVRGVTPFCDCCDLSAARSQ